MLLESDVLNIVNNLTNVNIIFPIWDWAGILLNKLNTQHMHACASTHTHTLTRTKNLTDMCGKYYAEIDICIIKETNTLTHFKSCADW